MIPQANSVSLIFTMKYIDEIDVQILDSWYISVREVLFGSTSIFIIPNIHFTTYAIYDVVILI